MQHKNYQLISKIGEGEHGAVFLVCKNPSKSHLKQQTNSNDDNLYALKKIPHSKNSFDFQVKTLLSLNHPNVIKVSEVFQQKDNWILILQLAEQGDLHQYSKRNFNNNVPQKIVLSWLCQLSLGLYFLHHQNNIIHRDIKTRNILVKQNGLLKLADFGVARKLQKGEDFAKTSVGTPCYLSPQTINLGRYDNKSDVWSLGCLMYEITTGQKPFKGESLGSLLNNIVNNSFGQIPIKYSPFLRELIKSMLQKDPLKRPNILSILQNNHIKKKFKQLKQLYPEYQKINYPEQCPKTTKYLDVQDKKGNCFKLFSESLKTTKNQRCIKLEIQEKKQSSQQSERKSNPDKHFSNLQFQKHLKQRKTVQKSHIIRDNNARNIKPDIKCFTNSSIQIKGSELLNFRNSQKIMILNKNSQNGNDNKKLNTNLLIQPSIQNRKVQRQKFLNKSLKSVIANRTKQKTQNIS